MIWSAIDCVNWLIIFLVSFMFLEFHTTNDSKRRLGLAARARKGDVIDKMNNNRLRTQKHCYLVSKRIINAWHVIEGKAVSSWTRRRPLSVAYKLS
jgi:hypothetical protein